MDINRSQLRHSKIYTLPNPNSTPPKQKQTNHHLWLWKTNPPQADAEEDRNKLLDRIQQLADELQNVLDRSVAWGLGGRFGPGRYILMEGL